MYSYSFFKSSLSLTKTLLILISVISLTACGGGSSSGGGNQGGGSGSGGNGGGSVGGGSSSGGGGSNSSIITRDNAIEVLRGSQAIMQPFFTYIGGFITIETPVIWRYNPIYSFFPETCNEGGSYEWEGDRVAYVDSTFTLTIDNCADDYVLIDGVVSYQETGSILNYRLEATLSNVSFSSYAGTYLLNGTIVYSAQGLEFTNVSARHEETGVTFTSNDLSVGPEGNISGSFSHSELGNISLNYDQDTLQLQLSGGGNVLLTAEPIIDEELPFYPDYSYYQLDISLSGIAEFPDYPLMVTVPASFISGLYSLDQVSPTPRVDRPDSISRLDTEVISAIPSTDRNYDFLTHEMEITSAPENCVYELVSLGQFEFSFVSECQGQFTFELSTFDGHSTAKTTFDYAVLPLPAAVTSIPDISIEELDGTVAIQLEISNLEEDGPFDYSIVYGPAGLEIDENGLITGRPTPFIRGGNHHFNVAIAADNGSESIQTFAIDMAGEPSSITLLPTTDFCSTIRTKWSDMNGNGIPELACPLEQSFRILELNGNEVETIYPQISPLHMDTALVAINQQDTDDDGLDEVIAGYRDRLFVIDGITHEVQNEIAIPGYDPGNFSDYVLLKVEGDGYPGVVIDNKYVGGKFLLELDGSGLIRKYQGITSFLNNAYVGNIDSDAEPEIVFTDGEDVYVYDVYSDPRIYPIAANLIEDIDADNLPEIIQITGNHENGLRYSNSLSVSIFNSNTGELLKADTIQFSTDDVGGTNAWFANVDSDPEKEFVIESGSLNKLFVYDWPDNELQLAAELDIPETISFWPTEQLLFAFSSGYNYIVDIDSGFTQLDYLTPRMPLIPDKTDGMSTLYKDNADAFHFYYLNNANNSLGKAEISSEGDLLGYEILNDIPAPSPKVSGIRELEGDPARLIANYSPDVHTLYDLETKALLNEINVTTINSGMKYLEGDIDGDGNKDVITYLPGGGAETSWIDLDLEQAIWSITGEAIQLWLYDIDGDSDDEILVHNRSISSDQDARLAIYDYIEGNVELVNEISVPSLSTSTSPKPVSGMQDVDGDGIAEIVLLTPNQNSCNETTVTNIAVYNLGLEAVTSGDIALCYAEVPSMLDMGQKHNALIFAPPSFPANNSIHLPVKAYTSFYEIDPGTGRILWQSSAFVGIPMSENEGVISFGEDIYNSRKAAVFSTGIYTFE